MSTTVRCLSDGQYNLAEGIIRDEQTGFLWWTNIHAKELWRLKPGTGAHKRWSLPQRLGCFALTQHQDILLLALETGLVLFNHARDEYTRLVSVETSLPKTRTNDGRCDRAGNFIFGTMHEGSPNAVASFYRFDTRGVLSRLDLPNIAISNSICFSPDGKIMYWCDSQQHKIMQSDYDSASGAVSNHRVFVDLGDTIIEPDGSTVDAEGCLWNAQWAGQRVVRYRPDGSVDRIIDMPVAQPTCVTFGGAALETLYVTSARNGLSDEALAQQPLAGAVFEITFDDVRGLPENRWLGPV
ncbi:SMP-30/gluconolactonase/LRE family protein [Silvimonas sp.]|uniref:SMP-30/gluconolactonase/LRE family protein n=1 Tax=Silvimonas sp. TaxID=2650811 RepID=UPI002845DA43|nr:SMP-30/gluconolactonase/LRE family protein [Silvimonas sp.]MDR3426347.1 SMP-30/gluconolactonase/LRE family protein [Silvimonas sp.]